MEFDDNQGSISTCVKEMSSGETCIKAIGYKKLINLAKHEGDHLPSDFVNLYLQQILTVVTLDIRNLIYDSEANYYYLEVLSRITAGALFNSEDMEHSDAILGRFTEIFDSLTTIIDALQSSDANMTSFIYFIISEHRIPTIMRNYVPQLSILVSKHIDPIMPFQIRKYAFKAFLNLLDQNSVDTLQCAEICIPPLIAGLYRLNSNYKIDQNIYIYQLIISVISSISDKGRLQSLSSVALEATDSLMSFFW